MVTQSDKLVCILQTFDTLKVKELNTPMTRINGILIYITSDMPLCFLIDILWGANIDLLKHINIYINYANDRILRHITILPHILGLHHQVFT